MKKPIVLAVTICLIAVTVLAMPSERLGRKPFRDLEPAEIESACVLLGPPDQTVPIVEIKELVEYLRAIEIYQMDNSYSEYAGQTCIFTITKTDGTVLNVTAYNPFVIIDGVGYQCKYEPCEALNRYANRLLAQMNSGGTAALAGSRSPLFLLFAV